MMTFLTPDQNQGFVKGLGLGMGAVLFIYAGLFLWATLKGPDAVKAREDKLISSTVVMERVLPISPSLKPGTKITETEPPVTQKEESPVAVTEPITQEPTPTEPVKAAETVNTKPAEPSTTDDAQLAGLQKYANGMMVAPIDGLYVDTQQGRLPVKRKDGLSAFQAYKTPVTLGGNKPVISVAIADIGLSDKLSEKAIKSLPPEVSFIISPYATAIETWVKDSRETGHEVWLSLPMENDLYPRVDTGPHTLFVGVPERENIQKLEWVMGRTVGYVGLVANYRDVFSNAQNDVRPVLADIYKRGLAFVDSNGAGGLAATMATSMKSPYTNINVWIDKPDNTPETIKASLNQLEVIARESGFAAGVISANGASFREVESWLATLENKGFVLAPLSAQTGQ